MKYLQKYPHRRIIKMLQCQKRKEVVLCKMPICDKAAQVRRDYKGGVDVRG